MRYIALLIIFLMQANSSLAGGRFKCNYTCADSSKRCVSSGTRVVQGVKVQAECWSYQYDKTCQYPSKDDCRFYEHCYDLGTRDCLLRDSYGACVNFKKEFSCKRWQVTETEDQEAHMDLVERDGHDGIVCDSVPCIDGNCVDKSYLTNGEMMESMAQLSVARNMKAGGKRNEADVQLFEGHRQNCSKKPAGFSNCCPDTMKGWGKILGGKCTSDEQNLIKQRQEKLCVYVGKETKGPKPLHTNKHHYCCFSNLLEKVVQVEGRKQLGLTFGTAKQPDCRGLTFEELRRIKFKEIDFSEFVADLKKKFASSYSTPNPEEIRDQMDSHMNIKEYDGNEYNQDNNRTGINQNGVLAKEGSDDD